jgi:ubiquinone biosynthesis protein
MGRLGLAERRFLAEILHGLITRDYYRAAAIHFEAGYVPPYHTVEEFAQAMRAIGEPIQGRTAEEISMADLLGQLFAYTEVFDMQTRPELILLQKSMVIVEGVARDLDPLLNMWVAAEPVAKEWVESNMSLLGRLKGAGRGAETIGDVLMRTPDLLQKAEQAIVGFSEMAKSGLKLDEATLENLASRSRRNRVTDAALWVAALALVAIGLKIYGVF